MGVDRLIAASAVTRATFYKHYQAKENLVQQYITARHVAQRAEVEAIIGEAAGPEAALRGMIAAIEAEILRPGFRGCPFINAAIEFTDPTHPVRKVITSHRQWYLDTVTGLLQERGHPAPAEAALELLLARDGALCGGYAAEPLATTTVLGRIVDRVLAEASRS